MTKYKESHTRWQFANIEELVDYIAHEFEIEPQSKQSIYGTGSQLSFRRKARVSESSVVQFHNPILDHITSLHGELVIGSDSFNMRARRLGSSRLGISALQPPTGNFAAAHALTCYEDPSGLEICQSDDGSLRTYSDGNVSMLLKSYTDSTGPYWEMGTEVTTSGLNFEAAIINSRYIGEAFAQVCAVHTYDQDSDTNDNYLDEYEWGIYALQPKRVESLCRVQWNGRRISGMVSAGSECYTTGVQPWPDGWPVDWPPLSEPDPIGSIAIFPRSLAFSSRPSFPYVTKSVTIVSTQADPITVTVGEAKVDTTSPPDPAPFERPHFGGVPSGEFSNVSGQLTIPPNGSIQIGVAFSGESGLGSIPGSLRITWDSGLVDIALMGTLVQETARI